MLGVVCIATTIVTYVPHRLLAEPRALLSWERRIMGMGWVSKYRCRYS